MMEAKRILLIMICIFSVAKTYAESFISTDVKKAEEKLKATFSNINVTDFKPSPMPGLFEMNVGSGIIYFNPERELLFFGEIYDKNGKSLTAESLAKTADSHTKKLPMDSGITMGDPDGLEIIEFTDPECPFCRRYEQFILPVMQTRKIKRTVYFDTRIHPGSKAKAAHIICSKDKEKAFHDIYAGKIKPFKTCKQADEVLAKHLAVAEQLGVPATPSFLLDGKINVGFRPGLIMNYLEKHNV